MSIFFVGRRRIDLHLSNVFADLTLRVDYRDCLPTKRSFRVSVYGQVNGREILNANATIRMTSRNRTQTKRNPSPIPSLHQSQSQILSRMTKIC